MSDANASPATTSLKGDIRHAMNAIQPVIESLIGQVKYRAPLAVLSVAMALLLTGCIKPTAPDPDATLPAIPPTASQLATLAPLVQPTTNPAVSNPTIAPLPTTAAVVGNGIVAPDGLWKQQPVGPETVAVMFFHQGATSCIRFIFRATVVPHCASGTQTMAILASVIETADKVNWTVVAGRALDSQITAVSVEFTDGTSQPADVANGGFVMVVQGKHPARDVVPINAIGNLVGGKLSF